MAAHDSTDGGGVGWSLGLHCGTHDGGDLAEELGSEDTGESIFGREGNGIVQFIGTYSSLSFTTPNFENYYAFTVGEDATITDNNPPPTDGAVPEPGTLSLLTLGLIGLTSVARSKSRLS